MPITRPRAAIFDLDGTIIDNMVLHAEAFALFAVRHGLPAPTRADRAKLDGRRNSEIFPVLFGREMPRDEWLAHEHEKEALYRELSRGRLTPVAGLTALLGRLAARRIAVALATSAPELNVAHTLGELGLTDTFPTIVRGDQVARGKPAPDVFLEASRRVNVPPGECVVFEDAPMGITAARAAGMRVVAMTTSFTAAQFEALDDPPDLACRDFDAFLALANW
ncbi:MAG: HAD family phosphatase [Acidobacteriota bacterium]|nr:HAD family phosphatase [Acidobacteriota bacterium]